MLIMYNKNISDRCICHPATGIQQYSLIQPMLLRIHSRHDIRQTIIWFDIGKFVTGFSRLRKHIHHQPPLIQRYYLLVQLPALYDKIRMIIHRVIQSAISPEYGEPNPRQPGMVIPGKQIGDQFCKIRSRKIMRGIKMEQVQTGHQTLKVKLCQQHFSSVGTHSFKTTISITEGSVIGR